MRSSADFSTTVRSGARSGRRNVVLYARGRTTPGTTVPTRFGFIVSKAVGNAVTRNLVKRRLRAVAAQALSHRGVNYDVVVRALPSAATAGWTELSAEMAEALEKACRAADRKAASGRAGKDNDGIA
ncbi:ribonuclease P protein component [Arthrobacter halodurans]|uniref:Ribonuclease P protein component n=1 Tax=Arthrobacter halodurans TaxID=516699 RepID=A0ABV4UKJ1_9MICC